MTAKQKIVLFDMDGTLTPAREPIEDDMIAALIRLTKHSRVGIVTGSDMDYVMQQMGRAFDIGGVPVNRLDVLPCNGTKFYSSNSSNNYVLVSEADMLKEIGQAVYNKIISRCMSWQTAITTDYPNLPFTGTFFQYRGSLLNWCPIGRLAGQEQRSAWTSLDQQEGIREKYCSQLSSLLKEDGIDVTVALGGTTSFDIYPTGWDKTYALKHYPDHDIWFAGDRCDPGGNDWHIYEKLISDNRSFKVESTSETIELIDSLILTF